MLAVSKMANSGESTKEYRTIQKHYSNLVDNLGDTVDPAHFARKLRDKSLISKDIVEAASVVGILTGSQRIAPVIKAVRAQIKLNASVFHTFMSILKEENSYLADTISGFYTSSLELHALGMLESVSDWMELGHQLDLCPGKLLQLSQCGRDTEYCQEEVVSEWLKEDKEASWEKLCRALEQMGSEAEVLKIRERYISDDITVPVVTGNEEFVAKQVDKLEDWFADLTYHLQTEMEEKEVPVKRFRHSITRLPQAIPKEHLQYIKDSLEKIHQAEDIEKLFMYLNLYWTFFDCNLLEHFVRKHGSKELKEEMKKYIKDLEDFRKKTTVEQLLNVRPNVFQRIVPPPEFSQVTCKLERNASEYTLEELEQFRCRLCSELSLPTYILKLASFGSGCITVTWHVPTSEVHHFHSTTVQFSSISTELLQFKADGLFLEFVTELNAQAPREYTALTHLYLSSQDIGADKIHLLSSSLSDKSCLQYLDLSRNRFGINGAKFLAQILLKSTALTYLNLSGCDINTDEIALLLASLRNVPYFQHLNLSGNNLGSKGTECLAHILMKNSALTHLNVGWCYIDAYGMVLLSSSLTSMSCLQHLDLSWNSIDLEGAKYLAQALAENSALTYLDLTGCGIGDDGMALLSSSLRNLQHLDLGLNRFSLEGVEYLAQALTEDISLTYLDLNGNNFGSKGVEYLAQALNENTILTHLDLSGCDIGADGITFLSSSLGKSCLQSLNLSENDFGLMGVECLARTLTENFSLTHLDLSECDIGDDEMALLSSALRNSWLCLQHLDLSENDFGSKGAEYLVQALTENTALTYLNVSGCDIGADGIALLSSSLRNKSCRLWHDLSV